MAKKLTRSNVIGYALGDMGGVIAFGTIGSFLQMFYTDVMHISLPKITALMLVARIWDAINDPICGALIDARKPTKWGRFRPYVMWFSVPMLIAFVLTFVRIPGLTENQYLNYAYITYVLYGMLYTAVNIPYGSMASAMTNDLEERSSLSVIRSLGAGIGSAPGQILLPLFVYSTAVDTGAKYLDANKLLTGVIILAGFAVIVFFGFFKLTKEYIPAPKQQPKENVVKTVKALIKNRPFMTLSLASMLLLAGSMYTQTVFNYLFKNYFNKPGMFALVTVTTYLPMLSLMPFMSKLAKKFGKKEICSNGNLFAALSFLLLFIIRTHNPWLFLGVILISGIGLAFFTLEVWAMVNDVIDYHEKVNDRRSEGTTYASFSFFRKFGQMLAGIGASIAMAAIGYVTKEGTITQTQAVNEGIYYIGTLIPFLIYLCMYLLMKFGYPLSKKRVEALRAELDSKTEL